MTPGLRRGRRTAARCGRRSPTSAALRPGLLPGAGARPAGTPTRCGPRPARLGYLGVNLPEEYGGGGGGMAELSIVLEELGAAGCPLLMMVVSPAICGTVIARFGTDEQKQRWLPGPRRRLAAPWPSRSPSPTPAPTRTAITTTARRDGDDWVLTGRKVFISGVDIADATARRRPHRGRADGHAQARRCSSSRADAPGLRPRSQIPMELISPEKQFAAVPGRRPAARRRAGRRPRTQGCCSCSPGSTPSGSWPPPSRSASAATRSRKATDYARDPPGLGARRSAPTRPRPPARAGPDRARAAPG